MKTIKLLLLSSLSLFAYSLRGQFFEDSLQIIGIQYLAKVISPGEYPFIVQYYKDSITFDSTHGADEFYTVTKCIKQKSGSLTNSKYLLRVNNKQVFLSGTIYEDKAIYVSDKLIFDYHHGVGDVFKIKLTADTLNDIQFIVDH